MGCPNHDVVQLVSVSTVLQCLSNAERGKAVLVLLHKILDGFLIGPRILTQAPTNGLTDEEFRLVCSFQAKREQSLLVCLLLVA